MAPQGNFHRNPRSLNDREEAKPATHVRKRHSYLDLALAHAELLGELRAVAAREVLGRLELLLQLVDLSSVD